jgi:hypothetical protein
MFWILTGASVVAMWPSMGFAQTTANDPAGSPPPIKESSGSLLGDNVSLQTGYKVWVNKWATRTGGTAVEGLNNQASKFEPMQGPQATVTLFNRVFASFQYLASNYDFHDAGVFHHATTAIRSDITATAGVRIWRGFGLFGGYYNTLQRFSNFSQLPGEESNHATIRAGGPIVGLFGSVPLEDSPVSLYGNIATGWFRTSATTDAMISRGDSPQRFNGIAYSLEVGVNYAGPSLGPVGTSAQVGFRAQVIEYNIPTGGAPGVQGDSFSSRGNDLLYGPTFMVSAHF